MRVAALYDIHGNLPALDAVLEELSFLDVERIVVGGDVLPGPWPAETLDRLMGLELPTHFLYGNGEVAVLAHRDDAASIDRLPEQAREAVRWSAGRLTDEQARRLSEWPKTLSIEVPDLGQVLFCHATPRDENEIFTRRTDEETLLGVFAQVDASLVVCGHTHMQFDRIVGRTRVVNAGSVGMPFGAPGAFWLLLEPGTVELRRTPYDLHEATRRLAATDYPEAAELGEDLRQPRSEETMLELLSHAELR